MDSALLLQVGFQGLAMYATIDQEFAVVHVHPIVDDLAVTASSGVEQEKFILNFLLENCGVEMGEVWFEILVNLDPFLGVVQGLFEKHER